MKINNIKFLILTIVFLIYSIFLFGSSKNDSTISVRLSVVGDLMCHSPQFNYARVSQDSFDFNPVYREIKKYFSESDFVFGNLETVIAGKSKGYSGYPFFNTPDEYIEALYNSGFHLLTTSNNHSLDKGETGILRTIDEIKNNGLMYNGTFTSKEDRDLIRVIDIKGIKIAFLAYTYGTNGIPVPKGKPYLINLIDFDLIKSDIIKARKLGAEIVLVHYHYGDEYKREPNAYQKDVIKKTISFGADIIIGGHPHVLQPVNFFKTNEGRVDTGFVAYSLGNFISNQRDRYKDAGVILNFEITKNLKSTEIKVTDVSYIPTWVFKGETDKGSEFVILPLLENHKSSIDDYLTDSDKKIMKQAFIDTNEIMKKYTARINLYKEKFIPVTDIKSKSFDLYKFEWPSNLNEIIFIQ
ncbi:MAG TPA: CapA family protein [Ignavibacteriaceae bacterium]|nr:CapA family protein [Ignavibacteriaceae bacterium]